MAPQPPAGPPGAPPPGAGKGKGLAGLWKRKPGLVAGGAAIAAVTGIALYRSHSSKSGAAAAGSTPAPADTAGTTGYADTGTATPYDYAGGSGSGGGGYSGSGYDAQAASLQQQLLAYTSQISSLEAASARESATNKRQARRISRLEHPPGPPKRRRPAPRKRPVPPQRGKR